MLDKRRQRQEIRTYRLIQLLHTFTAANNHSNFMISDSLSGHHKIKSHKWIKYGSCESEFTAEGRASLSVYSSVLSICLTLQQHRKTQGWTRADDLTNGGDDRPERGMPSLPSHPLFKASHFYHMTTIPIRFQRHHRASQRGKKNDRVISLQTVKGTKACFASLLFWKWGIRGMRKEMFPLSWACSVKLPNVYGVRTAKARYVAALT